MAEIAEVGSWVVRAISEDGEAGNLPRFDVSREILPRSGRPGARPPRSGVFRFLGFIKFAGVTYSLEERRGAGGGQQEREEL